MDINRKKNIAASFPVNYDEAELNITISKEEYDIFKRGIYADGMDEKWNIFVLNNVIVFARSWTGNCIFKIYVQLYDDSVLLKSFQVNRNKDQYGGVDLEDDSVLIKKLLQSYLKRDDLYVDPKLELQLIREMIEQEDPNNEFTKSIGTSSVGQLNQTYNTLIAPPNDKYFRVNGWEELRTKVLERVDSEPLISLYLQHKTNGDAKTLYFDGNAGELLGAIVIIRNSGVIV